MLHILYSLLRSLKNQNNRNKPRGTASGLNFYTSIALDNNWIREVVSQPLAISRWLLAYVPLSAHGCITHFPLFQFTVLSVLLSSETVSACGAVFDLLYNIYAENAVHTSSTIVVHILPSIPNSPPVRKALSDT